MSRRSRRLRKYRARLEGFLELFKELPSTYLEQFAWEIEAMERLLDIVRRQDAGEHVKPDPFEVDAGLAALAVVKQWVLVQPEFIPVDPQGRNPATRQKGGGANR